jgi:hypothetical protein
MNNISAAIAATSTRPTAIKILTTEHNHKRQQRLVLDAFKHISRGNGSSVINLDRSFPYIPDAAPPSGGKCVIKTLLKEGHLIVLRFLPSERSRAMMNQKVHNTPTDPFSCRLRQWRCYD